MPAGTRFGEFEILRVLGVGGFGIVYLARDHSLEREVALKEYMPASLAARGAGPQITVRSSSFAETYAIGLRSFINEARLLARFDHPSLVKVYRFWEDNATAYMVMPFLQGITLRDARRGMPNAPDEAWIRSVLNPILSALELLHREGVYHRDIAPDNILLPRDGPPVLLDFGAARRVISDRTQSLTAILKPSYAPIEQYAEMTQLRQGPWTDIYALGAVVHYLCFGVPPAPATARAVQDDGDAIESRIVPGVSPRFLEAMSWMLAIRPNQRPQSGEQLRAVLDGRAEVPPRGRPGVTVPGALAGDAAQIEQAADATRINTAYLPTHLPTAHVAPPTSTQPTSFSPTAPMPTARSAPLDKSQIRASSTVEPPAQRPGPVASSAATAPLASPVTTPTHAATGRDTPASQPASWAASRPQPLAAGAAQGRPAAAVPPVATTAPLAAAQATPTRGRKTQPWLVIAGGGVFVAVAALAAWQFSARRDASAVGPAALAASAAASVSTPATAALPPTVPGTPIIIETADPEPTKVGKDATKTLPPAAVSATTATDAGARTANSHPPLIFDGSAASAARARPAGKPVPRVGDDPALAATNPNGTTRPFDPANPQGAAGPGGTDRGRAGTTTTARDALGAQRPAAAVTEAHESILQVCGKQSFFSRAVCMDERCEEPRFRSTPECADVLARKNRRGQQ